MMVSPLTHKALTSIMRAGYLNVWEGAVRSGKTVASELAWIHYVSSSPESSFLMSGKTQGSLYRNVIGGNFGLLAMLGSLAEYKVDRQGNRILTIQSARGAKHCYCFGANDDRSFQALRGFTPGGWYADEVNLHPRSFVEEAFRRTIVSSERKHFWTLNPDNPNHYIYSDFLDKYEDEGLPGFYLWKFYLDDNLAISTERKAELRRQYSGVFYRRYILGERCVAEGVIFDMLTEENFYTDASRPLGLPRLGQRSIAIDYGTTNPCVMLDIYDTGDAIYLDREYYHDSAKAQRQKTDAEYVEDYLDFRGRQTEFWPATIVDPSAASFMLALKGAGVLVTQAKNDVLDGIRKMSTLFSQRKLKINRDGCPMTVKELSGYAWDEQAAKTGDEKPIKVADHSVDALRYFVNTALGKWRTLS
jgi:PBSX family phage terminase large subunit